MKKKNMKVKTLNKYHIKTPMHLWFMGLFFILVYSIGMYDYFMVRGHNVDYLNSLNIGEAVITYFTDYPKVFLILWTINIFSGLIAPILLLFRSKWAVWGGLIAIISKLCLDVLTFAFRNRWNVFGPWLSLIDITILLITCGFFFYCKALAKRGLLK